jgi:uncharacterized protein
LHIDPWITVAGLFVGFTVGLTGMGGGALMTPILVLIFKVNPLTAVSSDVVASLVMKPVAGGVHLRRGTVNMQLVRWLCTGSVPAAFCGVLILRSLGHGPDLQHRVQLLLGVALLVAAVSIFVKGLLALRRPDGALARDANDVKVKVVPTLIIGVAGGLIVGMTSVGSGSLIIVLLLFLYPRLSANQLVGTDLVQAVPLVAAAALGHVIFGDFQLSLTAGLLLGAVPGAYLGARVSASAPDRVIRPALMFVLTASALKLLGLTAVGLAFALAGIVSVGAAVTYAATVRQRGRAGAAADAA